MKKIDQLTLRVAALEKQYDGEIWLDSQDIYQLLHISKRTLQSWRDNGIIPYHRHGRMIWYKRHEVDAAIENMRVHNELVKPKRSFRSDVNYKKTGYQIS